MTLLFVESYGVDMLKWDLVNFAARSTGIPGRYGDVGVGNYGDNAYQSTKTITPSAKVTVGMAYYSQNAGAAGNTNNGIWLYGDTGTVIHLKFYMSGATTMAVARGDNTVLATGTVPNPYLQWNFIEVQGTIADSGGRAIVKWNGTTIIDFTGDTKNGGTSTNIDYVRVSNVTNSGSYLDDVYIANGLGSVNNDFLGEIRIVHSLPTGAGSSTQLTPSTGSNWDNVNDIPPVDTTYNGSATPGLRDTYALADITTLGSVLGVQVYSRMLKSDAGAASMKPAIKSGTTVAYGATRALNALATTYTDIWETDPNTATAWTPTAVNALEAGAEVV